MKRGEKVLALVFIIGIILILSVNVVSASLLTDIGKWINNLFGGKGNNINGKRTGELGTFGIMGGGSCFPKTCSDYPGLCGSSLSNGTCNGTIDCSNNCLTGQSCNATGQCICDNWTQRTSAGARNWFSIASSSDGTKLVAVVYSSSNGYIYTSSDSGVTWTERTSAGARSWYSVVSSSDGTKLAAVDGMNGYIYTSNDSGVSWVQRTGGGQAGWTSIASSSDGTKLAAAKFGGNIYTSNDSGVSWTQRTSSGSRAWYSSASSGDGTKLAAVDGGNGYIYTSGDSGVTWTNRTSSGARQWRSVASSTDGTKLAAVDLNGYIYTSGDSGVSWTQRTSAGARAWISVTSSSDGTKLAAVVYSGNSGYIYTSSDSGVSWTQRTSAGARSWYSVASSSDGKKLAAVSTNSGYIYTYDQNTCPPPCTDTCTSLGYSCGTQTVCGVSKDCGSCGSGQSCNNGACVTNFNPLWDIDKNSVIDNNTDGNIITSYLFGMNFNSFIGANAQRNPSQITTYLNCLKNKNILDIDGNNISDALSDGVLINRYMMGYSGQALINGVIGIGATRTTPEQIISFLNSPPGYNNDCDICDVNWIQRTSAGQKNWKSIASSSDGTKLAAVESNFDYIYTSSDSGVTWTQRTSAGARSWYSVASSADGTKLAAVDVSNGSIYTSSDSGVSWTQRTSAGARAWISVTSSSDGTKLAAVQSNLDYIYTSSDSGVSWTQRTSAGQRSWNFVASSSDGTKLFSGASGGYIFTSSDSGVSWTQRVSDASKNWRSAASSTDGTKLAVVDVSSGYIYTSSDSGVSWTQRTSAGSGSWTSIASSADGTKLAAVKFSGNIYTSSDSGVSWTLSTGSGTAAWYSIASSSDGKKLAAAVTNGGYIYTYDSSSCNSCTDTCASLGYFCGTQTVCGVSKDCGSCGSGQTCNNATGQCICNNNNNWVQRTNAGARNWKDVASSADGTKLAAIDSNLGYIYTSSDSGVSWINRTNAGARAWFSVASSTDGTKLAAIDSNYGYIYTSSDSGVSWTARTSTGTKLWRSITTSSDSVKLAAVAYNGYIYTSSDSGVSWVERNSSGSRYWNSIASSSDGTKLVAVNSINGYIYTSSDSGVSWVERTNSGARSWFSVASSSDGTKLAAVDYSGTGYGGYIYTTSDSGATWIQRTSAGARYWISIATSSDGTKLAAVVYNSSYIYTSNDSGVSWVEQTNAGARQWTSIASSSDGKKLAAGVWNGYIYTYDSSSCNSCTDTCSSLGYFCGNQMVCGVSTNCGSCNSSQTCSSGICVNIICSSNTQCGTNKFVGNLFCQNGSVYQNYTSFVCINPGLVSSYCTNVTSVQLNKTCNSSQTCSNGACVNNIDNIYPQFSNYWDNNGSIVSGGLALFNVTVMNTNGTVLLSLNGINYSASYFSQNLYKVSLSGLLNGTYNYKWLSWGNGSSHNFNSSSQRSYTVNAAPLTLNAAITIATLKDSYAINEHINLTDPPDDAITGNAIANPTPSPSRSPAPTSSASSTPSPTGTGSPTPTPPIIGDNNLYLDKSVDISRNIIARDGINNPSENQPESNGYIVEFVDKPLALKVEELEVTANANEARIESMSDIDPMKYYYSLTLITPKDVPGELNNYKNYLKTNRDTIMNNIARKINPQLNSIKPSLWNSFKALVTGNAVANPTLSPSGSPTPRSSATQTPSPTGTGSPTASPMPTTTAIPPTTTVVPIESMYWDSGFYGVLLVGISAQDARNIENIEGVSHVSPNSKVDLTMMDSVPLIGANKVWQLDSDGNNCSQTGKPCLTGKNITIGIIDTGIDYTHPDLCLKSPSTNYAQALPLSNNNNNNNQFPLFVNSYGKDWKIELDSRNKPSEIYGGNIPVSKLGFSSVTNDNVADIGIKFLNDNYNDLGINTNSIVKVSTSSTDKMYANQVRGLDQVIYQEYYNKYPIYKSYINVNFINNKIVSYNSKYYDIKNVDLNIKISSEAAQEIAKRRFNIVDDIQKSPELVIYPQEMTNSFRLSYKIDLPIVSRPLSQYTVFVDAVDGGVLDYYNNIITDVSGKVSGNIYPEYPKQSQVEKQFSNNNVNVDTKTGKTDINGNYNIAISNGNYNLNSKLEGPWVVVKNSNNVFSPYYIRVFSFNGNNQTIYMTYYDGRLLKYDLNKKILETVYSDIQPYIFALDTKNKKIYFANCSDGTNSPVDYCNYKTYLYRSNLDKSNTEKIAEFNYSSDLNLRKFKIDYLNNKIYWINSVNYNSVTKLTNTTIKRANLDGTNRETIISYIANNSISDFALSDNKIFLLDKYDYIILSANLNGTGLKNLLTNIYVLDNINYNSFDNKLYTSYFKSGTGVIQRFNTDGTNVENFTIINNNNAIDLYLDYVNNKAYYYNTQGIKRLNFDKTNIEDVPINSGDSMHSASVVSPGVSNWNWDNDDSSDRNEESNVFYHTNKIHDIFKSLGVNEADIKYTANVEVGGTCNAYYTSNSINFYGADSQCENTALLSDVIYHEYTHGIVEKLIKVNFPYYDQTGNLNEAWADYFAATTNDNSCMAEGFFKTGANCLRDANNNKKWPKDYSSEPHTGAPIITGALWDLRKVLGKSLTDNLTLMAIRLQPVTFSQFLTNVIIADDNNTNLTDGTPHLKEICNAFYTNHNVSSIYCSGNLPSDSCLNFPNSKVVGGYDFSGNVEVDDPTKVIPDNDPMDYLGHGTHCAGIAAGSGGGGLKGVAPDAKLYAYKVFPNSYPEVIISAIERSMDPNQDGNYSDHLDVISLSLGGGGNPDDAMSHTIDNAVSVGVIAVIAAGNSGSGSGTIQSPGNARKAITVGATDKTDIIASFSSRGPVTWTDTQGNKQTIIKPDIVAPGVNICSAEWDSYHSELRCLDNKHIAISGTSMATPMVAGSAALLKQRHPDWSPDDIKQTLKNTANSLGLDANTQGAGRVNLSSAIKIINRPLDCEINIGGKIYDQDILNITGTAKGYNFKSYSLYYITEYNYNHNIFNWIELYSSNVQVDNNLLYSWYMKNLPDGAYIIKLVVRSDIDSIEKINKITKITDLSISKQITTNTIGQYSPAIYGDKIVWEDWRNGNADIYMYDLSTNTERQITTNTANQNYPKIYENKIVYEDYRNGNYDIYMYDLSTNTERQITTDVNRQSDPEIYGNKIVWNDNRNGNYDIYMYDLSTNTERQITTNTSNQYYPDIYGNKIVWYDYRNGNSADIYMYDLSTNTERQITTNTATQYSPAIYGDKIVWEDYRSKNGVIYMYDLSTNTERQITTDTNGQYSPDIYGNTIVWQDYRNGNYDIYMYDLSTNTEKQVTINEASQYYPRIYENKVVYEDYRNGNYDIYLTYLSNRPQSKLTNNANYNLTGNLKFTLQKNISGVWSNIRTVTGNNVPIPANGFLKLDVGKDNLGKQVTSGFNNLNFIADSSGDYKIIARFDANSQFINNSWNFKVV